MQYNQNFLLDVRLLDSLKFPRRIRIRRGNLKIKWN